MYEKDKIFLAWIISSDLSLLLARVVRNNIKPCRKRATFNGRICKSPRISLCKDPGIRGNRGENKRELVKKYMEDAGSWIAGDR